MFDLPICVTIEDKKYPIRNKGDYRMVLDCFNAMNDEQLSQENQIVTALIIFYDNVNDEYDLMDMFGTNFEAPIKEMFKFFNCGRENSPGTQLPYKLVDWEQDSQLIAAAMNDVSRKELRLEPYVHWWTFMGYYISIGESAFSTVVGIRSKIKKGKKLEKYEQEFKNDNPQYFVWDSSTKADREAMDLVNQIWNKG